jgi:hypothetical protein
MPRAPLSPHPDAVAVVVAVPGGTGWTMTTHGSSLRPEPLFRCNVPRVKLVYRVFARPFADDLLGLQVVVLEAAWGYEVERLRGGGPPAGTVLADVPGGAIHEASDGYAVDVDDDTAARLYETCSWTFHALGLVMQHRALGLRRTTTTVRPRP